MPEFKARDEVREAEGAATSRPTSKPHWREPQMALVDHAEIPRIEAFGCEAPSPLLPNSDRGGAIPPQDSLALREAGVR